jgi:hypothetical protein
VTSDSGLVVENAAETLEWAMPHLRGRATKNCTAEVIYHTVRKADHDVAVRTLWTVWTHQTLNV